MPEFLELLPPGKALEKLLAHLPEPKLASERVPVAEALGRVTAEDIFAPEPLPGFDRSTVDGYAVRARDTYGASDTLPAYLMLAAEVPMGGKPDFLLQPGQAALIHTGGMLPEGADAVVMLEHTQQAREGEIEVLRAVAVAENILRQGEDVDAGALVLPAGTLLRPAEIGGLCALGLSTVTVTRPPRVALISSGDEVVPPEQAANPGQVRDVNSYSLSALVEQAGGLPARYGIVPDRAEAMEQVITRALAENDAVVITAGSSASTRDLTADAIQRMGEPGVLVHGVNVRPGKPTILGVCAGKPVIGLPGNPVSALVIAHLFVRPVIRRLSGLKAGPRDPVVFGRLAVNLASVAGREDYLPVTLSPDESAGYRVEPVYFKSNLIFTLAKADGLLHIPAAVTGYEAGATVRVLLI